jgi:hypothetical protein
MLERKENVAGGTFSAPFCCDWAPQCGSYARQKLIIWAAGLFVIHLLNKLQNGKLLSVH